MVTFKTLNFYYSTCYKEVYSTIYYRIGICGIFQFFLSKAIRKIPLKLLRDVKAARRSCLDSGSERYLFSENLKSKTFLISLFCYEKSQILDLCVNEYVLHFLRVGVRENSHIMIKHAIK